MGLNSIIDGDCVKVMADMPADSIDLTVTSPPYDDLRNYNGYTFNAEDVLAGLFRITKPGGAVVWVVCDSTKNGGRTLTSFRQAITAQGIGWKVHDVIIYQKMNTAYTHKGRYTNAFEYMFVFSKGKPKTFNGIRVQNKRQRTNETAMRRGADGIRTYRKYTSGGTKVRTNIWQYATGAGGTGGKMCHKHPAPFPEKLALDCVKSWSEEGDLVLDPMCGSGTTCLAAKRLGRNYIGIDISAEYCELARKRVAYEDKSLC